MMEIGIDMQMMTRGADVAQEDEDDRDHEEGAEVDGFLHGVDRPLDELGLIVEHRQVDRCACRG